MASAPQIMISSTCYDLRQIRANIEHFIRDDLGFIPLLSETPSFPIEPDLDTIENCRSRVIKDADAMVLVIGGRYGYVDGESNKSITNLEYLAAQRKGIPIYTFVASSILSNLPVWESNQTGDFSAVVDNTRLFEFVRDIRSTARRWTFPFDNSNDIINALRQQFAYLFKDGLGLRLQLKGGGIPAYLLDLGPDSLRIALERPECWEQRLFLRSFADQVQRRCDTVREYQAGLRIYKSEYVPLQNCAVWSITRLNELQGYVQSAVTLYNDSLQKAFGPPGTAGDPECIVWVSRMLGKILDQTLSWANTVRCAHVDMLFKEPTEQLALAVSDLIEQFRSYPSKSLAELEQALMSHKDGDVMTLDLTMTISVTNGDAIIAAIDDCVRKIQMDRVTHN